MGKLVAIRVRNLRSLEDTGFVELRPITVLVGRNSAGKSTFARVLPLLRQTAEVRKREPVLWWGRFVDFGSFADSVSRSTDTREIEISFRVAVEDSVKNMPRPEYIVDKIESYDLRLVEASLTLCENEASREAYLSKVVLKQGGNTYSINFGSSQLVEQIKVNNFSWRPTSNSLQKVTLGSLFPEIEFLQNRMIRYPNGEVVAIPFRTDPLRDEVFRFFSQASLVHGNTGWDSIRDICGQLDSKSNETLMATMKGVLGAPPSWLTAVANMSESDWRFIGLRDRLLASNLDSLLRQVDDAVTNTVANCSYIEPVRATAERYYRKQGLAVAEVDSKGSNVPFFLESLTSSEREKFDLWMEQHLQAKVRTSSDGGHLSIRIKDLTGLEVNLADVGFGFSQVLPVALQLWAVTRRPKRRVQRSAAGATVVIEQPELHLHPEYQAKIADLLKSAIEAGDITTIVETHSPSIINRLGILVATGKLSRDKVQVLRFEKDESSSCTTVSTSEFDDDGILMNWPFGFFDV